MGLPGDRLAKALGYNLSYHGGDNQSASYMKDGIILTIWNKDMVLLEIKHPDILPEYFANPEGLRWGEVIPFKYISKITDFQIRTCRR